MSLKARFRKFMNGVLTLSLFGVSASASQLFVLDESKKGKCTAKIIEVQSGKARELFTVKSCPTEVLWLDATDTVYFRDAKNMWSKSKGQKTPQKMAKLPVANVDFTEFWIDKGSRKLRFAVLEEPVSSKNICKNAGLPVKCIASAHEYRDGKWVKLEEKCMKGPCWDGLAEVPPNMHVLSTYKKRETLGFNLEQLRNGTTCLGDLNCHSEEPRILKALGKQEGYGRIGFKNGIELAFSVIFGDAPHTTFPVRLCKDSCKSATDVLDKAARKDLGDQLALAADKNFLLIAREYENSSPRVIDVTTNKVVLHLPKARAAVWLR